MAAGAVAAPHIIPIIPLEMHRPKNHIDTNTLVSIHSGTPGVLIFYTLDGSKPAAVRWGSLYSEPILLPAGRVTVRALGATRDGRESATVTKVFSVDLADAKMRMEDEEKVLKRNRQSQSEGACLSTASSLRPPGPRFLKSCRASPPAATQSGSSRRSQSEADFLPQLSSTHASEIQRQTDFLRCPQCLSCRPPDPFARFCAQCGAVVPPILEQRPPPAEGGQPQMVCCVFCNNLVPVNTLTCLICEASVQQQMQAVCVENSASSVPSADSSMTSCCRCKHKNQSNARFCNWCGCKFRQSVVCVTCWRCGASGHPHATYCAACGIFLEVPSHSTFCGDILRPPAGTATNQDATFSDSADNVKIVALTAERQTQTSGLYYPSATELQKKEQQRALQLSRQQTTRDRRPLLTAISPGKGYWRKQLDHVCAHLRSYAQNNSPFRALLGEPRLGQVVSAVIQEDRYEVILTISFVSARGETIQLGPEGVGGLPACHPETLNGVTERTADSRRSDLPAGPMKPPKPPVGDSQLLMELGPGPGPGQVSIIQQVLDQGADHCSCGSDARHALAVAVSNGHHDVLPVLVQQGADVNQQSGRMKNRTQNTALHEAAALGSESRQCAEVLLSDIIIP